MSIVYCGRCTRDSRTPSTSAYKARRADFSRQKRVKERGAAKSPCRLQEEPRGAIFASTSRSCRRYTIRRRRALEWVPAERLAIFSEEHARVQGPQRRGGPRTAKLSQNARNGPSEAQTRRDAAKQGAGAGKISTRSGPVERRPMPRKFSLNSNVKRERSHLKKRPRAGPQGRGRGSPQRPGICRNTQRNATKGRPRHQQTSAAAPHDNRATGAARRY